uniref:AMOP domain protein n=1 Tax=Acrobeloides nanus TaxID=290746 RepID=A0A914D8I4_9BILA
MVQPGLLTAGQTIDLHMYFPFYGGLYNYTTLSVNGYMAFATVLDQGPTINIGPETTDWPQQQDPAMIAPYLCKQQIFGNAFFKGGVHYRLVLRQSMIGQSAGQNIPGYEGAQPYQGQGYPSGQTQYSSNIYSNPNYGRFQKCPGTGDNYVRCDSQGDNFLDVMMQWLQEGVAGATAFRADAAVVVTWHNTASASAGRADVDSGQTATYQVIWLTDQPARLSYVIINYEHLGFTTSDIRMNSRSGRCVAGFNGGNHTGFVSVDPTSMYKNSPKVLAQRSSVPHMVRGRYMFRVDDVVRPGGCSNKTGGTFPLLIYPNIVNILGEMSVDVNGMCLDRTISYVLMIERRQTATCVVLNPAIARCNIPKVYAWGTLTVYFQPQSGLGIEEKAFIGHIYFVPPTLDPMRLDIGNIYDWYKNPLPSPIMPISWYPRNFTNQELIYQRDAQYNISQDHLYDVQLGLYVIGYKEARDDQIKKFHPEHRVLARLTTFSNMNNYRWSAQKERISVYQIEQWYMSDWERMNELYTYRTGYLKLAPLQLNALQSYVAPQLLSGLVSAPISLHWLWSTNDPQYQGFTFSIQDQDARTAFVTKKATEMCHNWYDEDGAQWNFIRDTETKASCPCIEDQAKYDIGRFMPHPRCSQTFRDITCTFTIGAKNCYMSASNLYSFYAGSTEDLYRENYGSADNIRTGPGFQYGFHNANGSGANSKPFPTHYGQVCCYDEQGFLMQSNYQPVIKVIDETPYNPGYPLRAYEFGTNPYMGQFEVPGLSAFHHDYAPYFLCCKYAKFRCQLFYWRRPSSGCQNYQPPAIGESSGGGTFFTIDNQKFIFNEPGVYNYLYIPQTQTTPEVKIQIRLERYPNRKVDFSLLGRSIGQSDLVEPSNITVITGVAIEATGTDRVHVLARKDTRSVLVYVNNVERGQPEVYVVLEESQIGIRIRESYSLDIDRMPQYQESMGLLDLTVSVPPKYGVRPDGDNSQQQQPRQIYNLSRVAGVIRPFPDQEITGFLNQSLQPQDVNNDMYRQQIISQYLILGTESNTVSTPQLVQNYKI